MARTSRWRRRVLVGLGVVLLVVVVVVLIAPSIAGRVLPGRLERAMAHSVTGSVEIERTRLSWLGAQRLGPVVVRDADGTEAARLTAKVDRGLLGLLTGGGALGTITLGGDVTVIVAEDGTTNLDRIFGTSPKEGGGGGPSTPQEPPAPGEPVTLPNGLAGALHIDDLQVTVINPALEAQLGSGIQAAQFDVDAAAQFGVGADVDITLDVKAAGGSRESPSARDLGGLQVEAQISDLTGPDGVLQPESASARGSVSAADIPLALVDSLARADGWILDALGSGADATVTFDVSRSDADVSVEIDGAGITTDLELAWHDRRLRLTSPATLTWRDSGLIARIRRLAGEGNESVEFTALPEVRVSLSSLDVGLDPEAPGLVNIDGALLDMAISTSRIEATVVGLDGERTQVKLAPRDMVIVSDDLASSVALRSRASPTNEDGDVGTIETNLVLRGLAEEGGAPRLGPPAAIDGDITIRNYPTAVLQPLLDQVDLALAMGETFDADVTATANVETSDSMVTASLTSTHLGLDASLEVDQQSITTRGDGVRVTVRETSELMATLLADTPVEATAPGGLTLSVPSLLVDLEAMKAGERLGAVTAAATLEVGKSAGMLEGKAWSMSPLTLTAALGDSSATARLSIDEITHDGANLGGLTVDARADEGAEPAWLPATIKVDASAPAVSSDVLSLVPGLESLEPRQDIGETIDLAAQVTADTGDIEQTLSGMVVARSRELNSRARVGLVDGAIRVVDDGVMVDLRHAGQVIGKLLPEDSPLDVASGGWLRVRSDDLSIPIVDGAVDIDSMRGQVTLEGGKLGLLLTDVDRRQVLTESLALTATIEDSIDVQIEAAGEADQSAYTIKGDVALADSLASLLADPASLKPTGTLALEGLPTSLLAAFLPEGQEDAAFILLGATMNASLEAAPSEEGIDLVLDAGGAHASSNVRATLANDVLALTGGTVEANVPRGRARRLVQLLAPAADEQVRPATALGVHVEVSPWRLPLGDVSAAGALEATATLTGAVRLLMETGDSTIDASGATVTARVPVGSLAGGGPDELRVSLDVDARQEGLPLAQIDAVLATTTGAAETTSPITLTLDARDLDMTWVDALLGRPGYASGAIGPRVTLSIGTESLADYDRFTATIDSLRLKSRRPAVLAMKDDRIEIVEPFNAWWRINPDWFDQHTMKGERALLTLSTPPTLVLTVDTLVLSRGEGMFLPGVFSVDAVVESSELDLAFEQDVSATYTDLFVRVRDGKRADRLNVTMTLDEDGRRALTANAIVDDFADDAGVPSPDKTLVTLDASMPNGRSDVIDAMAAQDGRLLELLGPSVDLQVTADRFSQAGGSLKATATSPRTTFEVDGVVGFGAFVAASPVELTVNEITPALGATFLNGLPLGTIEKRPEDGPLTVVATGLRIPVDGDLSRLNGDVIVDVGVARFQTSSAFSTILDMANQRDSGQVGRRLPEMTIRMRDGVISYDRYTIPLGEFQLESEARSIDLVNQRIDIITWIPIGALGDEAAGQFNSGLGSALGRALPTFDRLTRVPWRTRGSLSGPTTLPDVQLFVENTGSQLLRPDRLLRDRLQGIFGNNNKDDGADKEGEDKENEDK